MNETQRDLGSPAPVIRLERVHVRFDGNSVLRDINLTLERGQSVVVIGESGCGKTVFLKLLIALLRPSSGRIWFDGRELHTLREKELIQQRLRFGYLFQGSALFDSMSVHDNISFPLREHTKLTAEQIRELVRQRLREVGLTPEVEGKKPAELSGGMKKRVALARAVILNPEVLLYDEPTSGLDPIMTDVINDLIVETHRRHGVTSVTVTHDMKTVRKVADRVIMLYPLRRLEPEEPQIIFDDSREDLELCPDSRVRQFVFGESSQTQAPERILP